MFYDGTMMIGIVSMVITQNSPENCNKTAIAKSFESAF